MAEINPCPRCGTVAEMYQTDTGPSPRWEIGCNSQWRDCDFSVQSTDKDCLPYMWNMIPRNTKV